MATRNFYTTLAINFLHSFIAAAVAVLLPLYLLEKNITIENIGLIFSVLSIIMLFFRFIFAVIADYIGTRVLFIGTAITHIATILAYLLSNLSIHFTIGKIIEGFRAAAFWSVNRTEIYHIQEKDAEKNAAVMGSVRVLATFFGRVAIGFILLFLSIQNSFLFLIVCSMLLFYYSLNVKNGSAKKSLGLNTFLLELRKKQSARFWVTAIVLSISAIYEAPLLSLVIPLYMATVLNSSASTIGLGLALYSISQSLASYLALKKNISSSLLVLGTILFGSLPFLLLSSLSEPHLLLALIIMGFGGGLGLINIMEISMARAVKDSATPSIGISLLVVPYRVVEFVTLAAVGFAIISFGYSTVFLALGVSFAVYALLAWRIL